MRGPGVRDLFEVQPAPTESVVGPGLDSSTSKERYRSWRGWAEAGRGFPVEHLLPQVVRKIERVWPAALTVEPGEERTTEDELVRRITQLGPWPHPYPVGHGQTTLEGGMPVALALRRLLFRRDLINGAVAHLLGDRLAESSILDIGCNCGFFTLDLVGRGAGEALGVDLRPENIARARFLAETYVLDAARFSVLPAAGLTARHQADVVLNLGVLYHVTEPLQLIRQTYELCREFAIIDTICHLEPVSGYILFGEKDTANHAEGEETHEFHPTYRGAIDTIRYAGFSEVFELVGVAERMHDIYSSGRRRCFLAMK